MGDIYGFSRRANQWKRVPPNMDRLRKTARTTHVYDSFRHQINLYFPAQWCGSLAQERALVTAAIDTGDGMEELYNYCVYANGRQMLATDDLCRDEKYAADLMTYTRLWPHTERYETIIRNRCAMTRNTERCLLNSVSTERRLCGCFLPQDILDRSAVLKAGYADSNVRCWYPPCQSDRTVKTRNMIDTVCPNHNIAICSVGVQLTAGGGVLQTRENLQRNVVSFLMYKSSVCQ